ncbi:MAG: hypothetical protein KDC07_06250 [Chitinophagaceae bacterium]|nr:hypothetical protein [Chitinophagaceae bacterium]
MIGKLVDKVTGYLEHHLDVLKLNAIERVAIVMGFCMFLMVSMMAATAIIIFAGIGLGIYIGELIDNLSGGYFIVTGIYLLLVSLIVVFKGRLLKWFAGIFVGLLTSNDDDLDETKEES